MYLLCPYTCTIPSTVLCIHIPAKKEPSLDTLSCGFFAIQQQQPLKATYEDDSETNALAASLLRRRLQGMLCARKGSRSPPQKTLTAFAKRTPLQFPSENVLQPYATPLYVSKGAPRNEREAVLFAYRGGPFFSVKQRLVTTLETASLEEQQFFA